MDEIEGFLVCVFVELTFKIFYKNTNSTISMQIYKMEIYILIDVAYLFLERFASHGLFSAQMIILCTEHRKTSVYKLRVIIQAQSFIIKCLSFRRVGFVQGYRLCIEKLHLNNPFLTMKLHVWIMRVII